MVRFKMFKISVVQFAILNNEVADGYKIQTNAEIKHTMDGSAIAVGMTFSFENEGRKDMVLQVMCEFQIHPDDLKGMTSGDTVTIPKETVDFFIAQTVGTARGVLHCKTEGTPFNGVILPPMNVTGMINSDLIIKTIEQQK